MKRFVVLVEDDFELLGNGLGNVADLQYLPTLAFLNILDRCGIKASFMVDAAQQLFFESKRATNRDIATQYMLWEETVKTAFERGHDIQLHIHPQWLNAQMKAEHVYLSNQWNLGQYSQAQQRELVEGCVSYLHDLLRPLDPSYEVIGYKAGAWGMQPSEFLMDLLGRSGVRIIMGARDGMYIPGNHVDFRNMEEPSLPYSPDKSDLTKVADRHNDLIMLPMQCYAPNLVSLIQLSMAKFTGLSRHLKIESAFYQRQPIPSELVKPSPLEDRRRLRLSLHPYLTHLKIGNAPFSYLKASFSSVVSRLREVNWPRIPIVIESHTKQFHGYYDDIERFLGHVLNNYSDEVEFGTVSSVAAELRATPSLVRAGNNSPLK
jgi:hypothetical protein